MKEEESDLTPSVPAIPQKSPEALAPDNAPEDGDDSRTGDDPSVTPPPVMGTPVMGVPVTGAPEAGEVKSSETKLSKIIHVDDGSDSVSITPSGKLKIKSGGGEVVQINLLVVLFGGIFLFFLLIFFTIVVPICLVIWFVKTLFGGRKEKVTEAKPGETAQGAKTIESEKAEEG